jgi:hypothetical protein
MSIPRAIALPGGPKRQASAAVSAPTYLGPSSSLAWALRQSASYRVYLGYQGLPVLPRDRFPEQRIGGDLPESLPLIVRAENVEAGNGKPGGADCEVPPQRPIAGQRDLVTAGAITSQVLYRGRRSHHGTIEGLPDRIVGYGHTSPQINS